jgi:molybdopterin/thiamine biosynthesis adenylyltransferase
MGEVEQINNRTVRFSDLEWYQPNVEVVLGGLGGIGSYLAYFLGRIECHLYVYELDTIDETNMGGQFYSTNNIGQTKAESIKLKLIDYCNNHNVQVLGKFEHDSMVCPICFSAFDNMEARKMMFNNWCQLEDKELFIDGRMNAENFEIYVITPDRIDRYKETLFDDSEVEDAPCSAKATSHCGGMIGSMITALFTNYLTNKKFGEEVRDLPFKTQMDIALMMLNTEV